MRFVLAHQLLWDEILVFVVPVLLVLAAVRWADRRSTRNEETTGPVSPGSSKEPNNEEASNTTDAP